MDVNAQLRQLAELIGALQMQMEVDAAIIGALLATHPNLPAVAAQWHATMRVGMTDELLHHVSQPPALQNQRKADLLKHRHAYWQDVLDGLIHTNSPPHD